jgi:hypothetical protein
MALRGSVTVPTVGRTVPIDGSGVIASNQRRGTMTMRVGGVAGLGEQAFHVVFDGFVIYMRSPLFARALPGAKSWIRFDIRKAGQQVGIDPSQMSTDPTKALDQLRAVSGRVERVGEEDVRGVRATHYRATVDLRRYPTLAAPQRRAVARQGVERLIRLMGRSKLPEEIWVDRDRHVRRLAFALQMRAPGLPGGRKVSMRMVEDLYGFGTSVAIRVPPADQTVDGNALARRAGAPQAGGLGAP